MGCGGSKDFTISQAELDERVSALFEKLDSNNNGSLEFGEVKSSTLSHFLYLFPRTR
jgi:Ca2+-binding EF-hand superfamily protein